MGSLLKGLACITITLVAVIGEQLIIGVINEWFQDAKSDGTLEEGK